MRAIRVLGLSDDLLHAPLAQLDHLGNLTGSDPSLMQLDDTLSHPHGLWF
jgi:hypothetical protein